MMKHRTFTWESNHGAEQIFAQIWAPESQPAEAVIALVHGQGEHSGRYTHIAGFYAKKGYAVMAIDLTGHGRSSGKRGHVAIYEHYLSDVSQLLHHAKEQFPKLPIFLYGHSMGGNIVLNFALQASNTSMFDFLVVTSPWLKLAFEPPAIKEMLGKIVRYIYGGYTEQSTLDVSQLSRDPRVPKAYSEDPLVHSQISVSAYFGILEAGLNAIRQAPTLSKPCLLMHGNGDQITSHKASAAFASKAPQALITYKEWEGLYHELHNEVEWEEISTFIHQWMQGQLK